MWARIAKWYRGWEQEQLDVLQNPSLAQHVPAGYRRYFACKVAALSPSERAELYRFSVSTRGTKIWWALGKLCLVVSLVALLINLAFLPDTLWWKTVIVANVIGLALATSLVGVWFNYRKIARAKGKALFQMVGLGVVGGVYGGIVATIVKGEPLLTALETLPRTIAIVTLGSAALIAAPLILVAVLRNRHYEHLAAQLQRDAEQERLARALSETQLRLLRAQIEPHFLFNTLGAVQQLAEEQAPRAAELTSHLIAFLRGSMSDMRCEQVSLETEFGLVDAYLRVMQIRMGERLRVRIDLPTALADTPIPSMLVLTLAENAIKHGIEPSLRGGVVAITAHDDGQHIRITVQDSGVGMSDMPGNGTGLENVRSRLRLAYGEQACLALSEAEPGLLAELLIPRKDAQ
jgi:signal transduction histidine kinase